MKPIPAAFAVVVLAGMTLTGQTGVPTEEWRDVFPDGAKVEQVTFTSDGKRSYYTTTAGDVWLYDRVGKQSARIIAGSVWDLTVSSSGDALAYAKGAEVRREQFVWVLPLDPKSGLASGSERRVSAQSGDGPSISPDGKWLAFGRDEPTGVGQSVVVLPIGGGTERVVAAGLPSSVGGIHWTPDGKILYFGVNPPVPFTCAESCLSLPGGNPQVPGTIRRVAFEGGPISVVATTGNPAPGLSPDGKKLVFADAGGNRQFVVADANGRRLDGFTLPPTHALQGWSGSSTLLTLVTGTVRYLRSVSISDQHSATLFEGDLSMSSAAWSPDGKQISVLRVSGDHCEIRIMDADGTFRTAIALTDRGCGDSLAWTADERRLVYTQYSPPDRRPAIIAVEIATGQTKRLRDSRPGAMNWVLDGNAVIVSEMSDASTGPRRVSFWKIDFDGNATLLRDLPFDAQPGSVAIPLDRLTAMVFRVPRDYRFVRLEGSTAEQVVSPEQNGYLEPRPSISMDKKWVAFRINPSGNDRTRLNVVELVRTDGTGRQRVELPFAALDQDTLRILPGGKDLVVVERPSAGGTPGVYLVDVATGKANKLFDYLPQGRPPDIIVSPGGQALLVSTTETRPASISAMDFSHIE